VIAFANPVDVPFSTDFSTEFSDFYAPTGNGYNWGHDWRAENYHSWISSSNRTVTATQQARSLEAKDFLIRAMIDPVELVGSGHSVGFGACGSSRTFGSYYLADVKPSTNAVRLIRISGGNNFLIAEQTINGLSLTDLEPFVLQLTGEYITSTSLLLRVSITKDGKTATFSATDSAALIGSYFGLRARTNGSGRFENHFDDYELNHLNPGFPIPVPSLFAPVGDFYSHVGNGTQPDLIPSWSGLLPSGGFEGNPSLDDIGVYSISYPGMEQPFVAPVDSTVIVPEPTDAIISEFMADNDDTLLDAEGEPSDWIELFNPSGNSIDLSGWHLSDDSEVPEKWAIPTGTILAPFEFKVVFASGKLLPNHANFRLGSGGGYLSLVRPDQSIASEFADYPPQREDISFGAHRDYGQFGYLLEPTPGSANSLVGFSDFVSDTNFSIKRGFFDAPFTVDVTCSTPGATITYTTDGSPPSLTNGTTSASPASIAISETTVLRAAAYVPGLVPANVDTQTYLFLDDIRTQERAHALADGWPSGRVNGQVFDYGMDPDITSSISEAEFEEAMTDIPTISFVTDLANFTDSASGFWVNAENRGRGWERPMSVELINPDATPGFQIDAGVRMRGGFSRQGSNPKHSFHLYFRSEYGTGKLDYPLFGDEGTSTFDALDLRATQGRSWHFSNSSDATFNRDVFARESQRDMGQPYTRSRHYHLYINGQYFGLFQSQERVDANYAAAYFGGTRDDYDVIKTRTKPHRVEALDGDPDAWTRLYDAAVAGFVSDSDYFGVQGLDAAGDPDPAGENLIDVDNLIDYMLVIFYTGQSDGPVNLGANVPKNFFAMRPRDGAWGFRFFVHDNEDSFQSVNANSTPNNGTGDRLIYFNPKWLHQQLSANPRYIQRFGDRIHRHLFNGGALTVAENRSRFLASANPIAKAVIGESARWGDFKVGSPYDQADWQNAINGKINSWIPGRDSIILGQLRSRNLYPGVTAPSFNQHGGQVPVGFRLTIEAPEGAIYYTLDGSDPSDPGATLLDGGASTDTLVAANSAGWNYLVTSSALSDSDVVVGHASYGSGDWKHPDFDDATWATGTAPLGYGGVGSPSWNTEISDGDIIPRVPTTYLRRSFSVSSAADYSQLTINIRRDDGTIIYLNGREIARSNLPIGNVAYADYANSNASGVNETSYFANQYSLQPDDLVEGTNHLAVEIHQGGDSSSDLVIDVELLGTNIAGGIPISSNTTVKSRVFEGGEWSALNEASFFTTIPASSANLTISEIYYNPPGASEETEYIELRNLSATDRIHLDGLRFTAGIGFDFPPGLTLAPGEFLLVVKNTTAFEAEFGAGLRIAGEYSGSLANGGEPITLAGITTLTYNDDFPWPESTDGGGRSLVFTNGDPSSPDSWRASANDGGSPGGSDTTGFSGGDFAEYAFGGFRPGVAADSAFSFPRNLAADDVNYTLETSSDLKQWEPAIGWTQEGETILGGSFSATVWQANEPGSREFVRMRAELNP